MASLPLSAMLSWALVAFTIEFDNEVERRAPHRTSNYGLSEHHSSHKPWLVSLVMWQNCLRFVTDHGITARELEQLARTKTNLDGMRRWGYIYVDKEGLIRPTRAGAYARALCPVVLSEIEQRWCDRYARELIDRLRDYLTELRQHITDDLPDCMPILRHGLFTDITKTKPVTKVKADLSLPALLARPLVQFGREFDRDSELSIALSANVLRPIANGSVAVRDLPALGGVSREATAMAVKFLQKRGFARVSAGNPKHLILTDKGVAGQIDYAHKIAKIEAIWQSRYKCVEPLRNCLRVLVGDGSSRSPLFASLHTSAGNWRSCITPPANLPHYPMVLHRGGYPDGS